MALTCVSQRAYKLVGDIFFDDSGFMFSHLGTRSYNSLICCCYALWAAFCLSAKTLTDIRNWSPSEGRSGDKKVWQHPQNYFTQPRPQRHRNSPSSDREPSEDIAKFFALPKRKANKRYWHKLDKLTKVLKNVRRLNAWATHLTNWLTDWLTDTQFIEWWTAGYTQRQIPGILT